MVAFSKCLPVSPPGGMSYSSQEPTKNQAVTFQALETSLWKSRRLAMGAWDHKFMPIPPRDVSFLIPFHHFAQNQQW